MSASPVATSPLASSLRIRLPEAQGSSPPTSARIPSSPSRGSPKGIVRQFSSSKLSSKPREEQLKSEIPILMHFFEIVNRQRDPAMAKGHFAVLMKDPLYKDQIVKVFWQCLEGDEKLLLEKYRCLNRAREKYAKVLDSKNRVLRDKRAYKYNDRRKQFKEFAQNFSKEMKIKYGIDVFPEKFKIPDEWVKNSQKFFLSEGLLRRKLCEAVPETLRNKKDYEIIREISCIGPTRVEEGFFKRVDKVFEDYLAKIFPRGVEPNIEELTVEHRHLYLTKKMGECFAMLMQTQTIAHLILRSDRNKITTQLSQAAQGKEGSWIKRIKHDDADKEPLTPRGESLLPFNHESYEAPLPSFSKDAEAMPLDIHEFGKMYRGTLEELFKTIGDITNIFVAIHPQEQDFKAAAASTNPSKGALERLRNLQSFALVQGMFMDKHLPLIYQALEAKTA